MQVIGGGKRRLGGSEEYIIDGADVVAPIVQKGAGLEVPAFSGGRHPGACYGHSDENLTNQDVHHAIYPIEGIESVDGESATVLAHYRGDRYQGESFESAQRLGLGVRLSVNESDQAGHGYLAYATMGTDNAVFVGNSDAGFGGGTADRRALGDVVEYWIRWHLDADASTLNLEAWGYSVAEPALSSVAYSVSGQTKIGTVGLIHRGHTNPVLRGTTLKQIKFRGGFKVGGGGGVVSMIGRR